MAAAFAGNIPESSTAGALFELVARGQKDQYFMRDKPDASWPYDARYKSSAHFLEERQTVVPLNGATFGATFECEVQMFADVLVEASFLIDLPTWYPPLPVVSGGQTYEPRQACLQYNILDPSGVSYGYTDYPGFFLFERIQLYQDQFLIAEWSGDGLFAMSALGKYDPTRNQKFLEMAEAGQATVPQAGYPTVIQQRACPDRLRLRLPIPGCQGLRDCGLPVCAMGNQTFRLRVKLRKLEDLIVDSVGSFKPQPWNIPSFTYNINDASGFPAGQYTFTPIERNLIGQPTILLETTQAYLDPDVRQAMIDAPKHEIPFRRMFENIFTIGELDYQAFDRGAPNVVVVRRLDGRHPTEEFLWFFRSQDSLDRNLLSNFTNDGVAGAAAGADGSFYRAIKLVTAGRDREYFWGSEVWEDVVEAGKHGLDSALRIGSMNWSLGDVWERAWPYSRQPEGTINMTTAYRPDLHVSIFPTDASTLAGRRVTEMRVFTVGWAAYEIQDRRGRLMFAN
ncbi:MAG: hypothetical protein EBT86_00890 [Actinobacteria bacterium]|nr:hypothetical protein [Actinomycetota bacterium]